MGELFLQRVYAMENGYCLTRANGLKHDGRKGKKRENKYLWLAKNMLFFQ